MFVKLIIFYFISINSANYLFPKHAVIFSHPRQLEKSYFGFAVQLQFANDKDGRLIVGAPRSNDVSNINVTEPGAVFSCSLDTRKCDQFDFDSEGTNDTEYIPSKRYSSLGFSLDSDDSIEGRLVACAPRWINFTNHKYSIPMQNGMCYYIKSAENIKPSTVNKLMPLQNRDLQFDRYTYNYILGQSGFSSYLVKDEDTIVSTALGVYNWTGSVIQYNNQGENDENLIVVGAEKFGKIETYSYFGYSLTYGRFNTSERNKIFYVSGAPRDNNLFGSVFIYEKLTAHNVLHKRFQFPGKQFGEYFGASVAVADLNGDGIDDVIIGAPMHSTDETEETGCIYTYVTQPTDLKLQNIKFQAKNMIKGEEKGSRFGTAISSIGDINKDGCEDIVVGAPYYNGKGAIYLYLGQKDKKDVLKFVQKIFASDCNPNLRGFGFSLSRGLDIDNNRYNDLAVGSYLSNHVIVLKSRPIISISTSLEANINQININTNKFVLKCCLTYTTKDVPTEQDITIVLEANSPQIIFENTLNNSRSTSYKKDQEHCEDINVTVKEGLMEVVAIIMTYKIINNDADFCKSCPIEENKQKAKTKLIPFARGCAGSTCKPNLKLSASFKILEKSFIIGSATEIPLHVVIENSGENSFGTKLSLQLSSYQISVKSEYLCIQIRNIVTCDFNKVLITNDKKDIVLTLNVENLSINETYLNVTMIVTSAFEDTDTTDNNFMLGLPLSTDILFNIGTKSEPEQLVMSENMTTKHFIHTYNIESTGKTELENLNVYFYIPYKFNNEIIADNASISNCIQENEEIVDATFEITSNEVLENIIHFNCSSTQNLKCKRIKCEIKDETKLRTTKMDINLDVNVLTFKDETESIYFVTTFETNSEYVHIKSYARSTFIPEPRAASLTSYIIIGVAGGLLLFLILAVILYKIGFFKRKKPMKPENEGLLEKNEEPGSSARVDIGDENIQNGSNIDRKEDDIMKEESDG